MFASCLRTLPIKTVLNKQQIELSIFMYELKYWRDSFTHSIFTDNCIVCRLINIVHITRTHKHTHFKCHSLYLIHIACRTHGTLLNVEYKMLNENCLAAFYTNNIERYLVCVLTFFLICCFYACCSPLLFALVRFLYFFSIPFRNILKYIQPACEP